MLQSWLQSSKGVYAQQDWVQACVEWIEQEEGRNLPVASVRDMVYEQWLHSDLREVASQPCIPPSVTEQQTTQISGRFIVQVDSLIDVGAAAYAQLQKMKGNSLDSVENSGNKKNFEPKPTRLLLMSLTDGMSDFQAMEYQPIPQLNTELTPGAKLMLQGTINCRLGTLLVNGSHVQVLGGGVESLIDVNQQKRIVARALKDESLAEEGGYSSATGTNSGEVVSSALVVPTNQATEGHHRLQGENGGGTEQNQTGGVEIEDLDLENFDDFGEMEDEFQDTQEQWPEEIDFSPRDVPQEGEGVDEEEMASTFAVDTAPHQSVSRTVGQKWRSTTGLVLSDSSVNMPGPSGMSSSKRSRVSQSARDREPLAGIVTGSVKATVASVRPMTVGGHVVPSGSISTRVVPVVMSLQQAADVWAANPLIRVKAHFVRVTGKLKPFGGKWTVAVVMEDDSGGQLDVELSNEVLENLIGFTAQEFVEHIQPNKRDPAVKARGSKGFKHCQAYLASLNCLMEIRKQSTFGDSPVVERLLDTE